MLRMSSLQNFFFTADSKIICYQENWSVQAIRVLHLDCLLDKVENSSAIHGIFNENADDLDNYGAKRVFELLV